MAGVAALLSSVPVYGFLHWQFGRVAFLNRMAITFGVVVVLMTVITMVKPLKKPLNLPVRQAYDMSPTKSVLWIGIGIILLTIGLYVLIEILAK